MVSVLISRCPKTDFENKRTIHQIKFDNRRSAISPLIIKKLSILFWIQSDDLFTESLQLIDELLNDLIFFQKSNTSLLMILKFLEYKS